jgi:hypothetical protein
VLLHCSAVVLFRNALDILKKLVKYFTSEKYNASLLKADVKKKETITVATWSKA